MKVTILDGKGKGNKVAVDKAGLLHVQTQPHPPRDAAIDILPFSQFFTSTGLSSGSSDMVVNGSSSPQEFSIVAQNGKNIFIKTISVQISDNGANLNNFGALTALTNGVDFAWFTQESGEFVIQSGIQTNLDFMRLGLGVPPIGSGTNAFKADISGGGADTYLPVIDLASTFGLPYGLKLRQGTTDKVTFTINDNLTGIDTFNIIGYGIEL